VGHGDDLVQERGIRLTVVERPGYGLSDRQPTRQVVDWADDVRQVADELGVARFAA
jgi:pimeloyl-ACP methyl ester carboxylesterase